MHRSWCSQLVRAQGCVAGRKRGSEWPLQGGGWCCQESESCGLRPRANPPRYAQRHFSQCVPATSRVATGKWARVCAGPAGVVEEHTLASLGPSSNKSGSDGRSGEGSWSGTSIPREPPATEHGGARPPATCSHSALTTREGTASSTQRLETFSRKDAEGLFSFWLPS